MNLTILGALAKDAVYQTLDNKVFRLLALLTMIPILFSFLIGFRDEEIVFFFGLWNVEYASLLEGLGVPPGEESQVRILTIQAWQSFIIETMSGTVGILFCVAATAFFVPRMLERGTADTLFSKPVSRASLLIARYLSGVLFVFLLSTFLVVGVHLGLIIVSGYSDPGFLWGILTLTYVFALVHSFSTCVAVLTRSSIAAILCTLTFFVGNGCVQTIWIAKEHRNAMQEAKSEETEQSSTEEFKPEGPLLSLFFGFINTVHYAGPKTADAAILTRLLRRSLEGAPEALEDSVGGLALSETPHFDEGTVVVPVETHDPENPGFFVSWRMEDGDGKVLGQLSILRKHVKYETLPDGSQGNERDRRLTSRSFSRSRPKELNALEGVTAVESIRARAANRSATYVRWTTADAPKFQHHEEIMFGYNQYVYLVSSDWRAAWLTIEQREKYMDQVLETMSFPELEEMMVADPTVWFQKQMSLTAPLKFNILFSIGSSVFFVLFMLYISLAALRNIDF